MCDTALSFTRDHVLPLLMEAANMIRGVQKEVSDMKSELEIIEDFIYDAVRMAETEADNTRHGVKTRVRQLREASFSIEDVIDEYMICEGQHPRDPGCAALPHVPVDFVNTMILRLQIAYKIQNIKARVHGMKEEMSSLDQGPRSCTENQSATLNNLRNLAPFYLEEAQVVGFEAPRDELIGWLIKGGEERTVISVVGMGGLGKTTLAKNVLDNHEVIEHFNCHVWITVSECYNVDGLLREMLQKFYKKSNKDLPDDIATMHGKPLVDEVRNYLQDKRYVLVFDDVWNQHFWDEMEFALIDKKKGSRIIITTRDMRVADCCKKSYFVKVHKLKPLTVEKSLELFCNKAFGLCCPGHLKDVTSEIVEKCEGLPLAIVAIGGLLSTKDRDALEWKKFSQNLSLQLEKNSHLNPITKILGFSYHDLPYYLKRCFLYFGIYPEDYEVKTWRLIRQWIAEGFVKGESRETVEEVAEKYLNELVNRSLVQVSSFASDGKTRSCRVHDLVRQMILGKIEDLSFCHFTSENENQPTFTGMMIRRITIATSSNSNNLMGSVESSNIRSLHIFKNEALQDSSVTSIPSKYRFLRVLDFEDVTLYHNVPKNLGDLFHLSYLSFRNTKVKSLPGSIGNLHNLETLDLRQTMVREIPREINHLRKLRHLLAYDMSKGVGYGIQLKGGIGDVESLQTLREVEADHGGVELIRELERLRQLRMLGVTNVKKEYTRDLCSSINNMQHLEKLYIAAIDGNEVIDLHFDVSAPQLLKLRLVGKLDKFPNWVGQLENLVEFSLSHSMLTHDPLASLKDLPNLSYLSILYHAFEGECLHFPDGGFRKLKQLVLRRLYNLHSILISGGSLCSLEKFKLVSIPELKEVPSGVYDLPKLQVSHVINMSDEFEESIVRGRGQLQWIIEKVPFTRIAEIDLGNDKNIQH
ncbi:Virus X resistance protein-like, coiled-coil domain [Sesbania bispinosa]|nr:Virus X resistance protein-like, coiled-coil domain [Sesbania bispinosa]